MYSTEELIRKIEDEKFDKVCKELYQADDQQCSLVRNRYSSLAKEYLDVFGNENVQVFSTPGRTEISGNHTDHNHGKVLAGSINLDTIAIAGKTNNGIISIKSEGYEKQFVVDTKSLDVIQDESGTSLSLVRGIVSKFNELGYNYGGFNAVLTSDVLVGSGLSSSAAFEVQIGTILNYLYNEGSIDNIEIAKIGQYAENVYFGKPCGLMDQVACAVGGIVSIDFQDPGAPFVNKVDFDFVDSGYSLLVVDTGGSHSDLTNEYASIPSEMKSVAKSLDKNVAREISDVSFYNNIPQLRKEFGDRAVLRVLHFINENKRVTQQVKFLEEGKFDKFLELVKESGNSSFKYLQNCYTTEDIKNQGISLALELTDEYLIEKGAGAGRVHGGGFAGTIQVFLPGEFVDEYINKVESIFGKESVLKLFIREQGSILVEI